MGIQSNESRIDFFVKYLAILSYPMAYHALQLVMKEMCSDKGFTRHNGVHYYFHLVDVAQHLLNSGVRDEDIVTAALLHDLVEDVLDEEGKPVYSVALLSEMYNGNVAHMVQLLTKDPNIDYKTDKKALVLYLKRISENVGASLIKCSDRLNNFSSLLDADPAKRIRTALETETYYIPFFKKCRKLFPWYAAFFFQAKTTIEPHLWAIKAHDEEVQKLTEEIALLKAELNNQQK